VHNIRWKKPCSTSLGFQCLWCICGYSHLKFPSFKLRLI
jgi:hypothetical protein